MRKAILPLMAATALFTACGESGPVGTSGADFMQVSMTGDVEGSFQGRGHFHTGTTMAGDAQFQIVSRGIGADSNRGFAITRWTGGQLATGTYSIDLVNLEGYDRTQPAPQGITLQYAHRVSGDQATFPTGQVDEFFVASGGSITITLSTPERIEGEFTATAFRYCARDANLGQPVTEMVGPCELPSSVIAGAPTTTVSGTFVAIPLPNEFEPMPWND
jgi:hypothetical protein